MNRDAVVEAIRPLQRALGRRNFLGSFASLSAVGFFNAGLSHAGALPQNRTLFMGQGMATTFAALFPVILPVKPYAMPDPLDLALLRQVDEFYQEFDTEIQDALAIGCTLFRYGSVVLGWHFRFFENLDQGSRQEYFAAWATGNTVQRGVYSALLQLTIVPYWRDERTWASIGYSGPTSRKLAIPAYGVAQAPGASP